MTLLSQKNVSQYRLDGASESLDTFSGNFDTRYEGTDSANCSLDHHAADYEESGSGHVTQSLDADDSPDSFRVLCDCDASLLEEDDLPQLALISSNAHDTEFTASEQPGTFWMPSIFEDPNSPRSGTVRYYTGWSSPSASFPVLQRNLVVLSSQENASAVVLVHHYTKHVVHRMQPVLHRENPFQTFYLPLALEGSTDPVATRDVDDVSSARVSVFHSLDGGHKLARLGAWGQFSSTICRSSQTACTHCPQKCSGEPLE